MRAIALPGAIIWWAWGMGVAYGDSGTEDGNVFIGTAVGGSGAFLASGWGTPKGGFDGSDGYTISLWFFQ